MPYRVAAQMQPAMAAVARANRATPATMAIMVDLLSVRNIFDETTMTAATYRPVARPLQ